MQLFRYIRQEKYSQLHNKHLVNEVIYIINNLTVITYILSFEFDIMKVYIDGVDVQHFPVDSQDLVTARTKFGRF